MSTRWGWERGADSLEGRCMKEVFKIAVHDYNGFPQRHRQSDRSVSITSVTQGGEQHRSLLGAAPHRYQVSTGENWLRTRKTTERKCPLSGHQFSNRFER
ncbi:hypothetical protein E2C01_061080 [Portunus trituberculatus]|uniref:Uncharacterized protein n=1 Tax=Portunus trituberculatus TaxID=210409 RepID=A0A5B7HE37_PORTR|nr:hypothetical protein [Portunus trituberculatus]